MKKFWYFKLSLVLTVSILVLFSCSTLDQTDMKEGGQKKGRKEKITVKEGANYLIAVSPFSNISGDEKDDYIGFQISEYITAAMTSFPGITVIERENLYDIIQEQKLQLTGFTEEGENAVEIGALLNAEHMIFGSFQKEGGRLTINGRIVDVEKGNVLSSESVTKTYDNNLPGIVKQFVFQLLDRLPEYEITIPVEAKMSAMEYGEPESDEYYAMALEAIFKDDDQKALEYLEKSVSGATLNMNIPDQYLKTYSVVYAEDLYVKMVKEQVENNRILMEEAEKLSVYRNTLKILVDRVSEYITPDSFEIDAVKGESIKTEAVSARVTLPSKITIKFRKEVQEKVLELFDQQEVVMIGSSGVRFKEKPEVERLFETKKSMNLFMFEILAEISYSIQFLDRDGDIMYQLNSEPVIPFKMGKTEPVWTASSRENYTVEYKRTGWKYANGKVEIQARELKKLSTMQVVIDRKSFHKNIYFPVYEDNEWKSFLLHLYRKNYIKITGEDDECPQVKDIVISDYFFDAGPEKGIPLICEKNVFSSFAQLTAAVYWGDNSKNTRVSGVWSGAYDAQNEDTAGDFSPESVLYFDLNIFPPGEKVLLKEGGLLLKGEETFTAANEGQEKSVTFHLDYGKSWAKRIYTRTSWEGPFYATSITGDGSKIFRSNDEHGTVCLNAETGEELWRRKEARGSEIYFNDNKVFVFYYPKTTYTDEELFCLNADTGEVLWSEREYSVGGLLESEEGKLYRIFVEKGTYKYDSLLSIVHFDTATGKALSQTKMIIKRFSSERYGFFSHIYNNKLYVKSRYIGGDRIKCFDINNGSLIWESNCKSNTWVFFENKIYVSYYDSTRKYSYIYCLDADTGEEIWDKKIKEDTFSLTADNDFVVISTGAWWPKVYSFSASTGKIIWESQDYIGLLWPVINNGKIYSLVDQGGGIAPRSLPALIYRQGHVFGIFI